MFCVHSARLRLQQELPPFAVYRRSYNSFLMLKSTGLLTSNEKAQSNKQGDPKEVAEIVALFRLLMREPPSDHDFRTCPICMRYGIIEI